MPKTTLNEIVADPVRRANLERRFWSKVDVRGLDECWPWMTASVGRFGYGRIGAGRGNQFQATRVAIALTKGLVQDGMSVCHRCDNPPCCNPNHLFVASQKNNLEDARQKGRSVKPPRNFGEKHPAARFDAKTAEAIIQDSRSAKEIARQYGVHVETIYRHKRHQAWSEKG